MNFYGNKVNHLVEQLSKLPSIGSKSAQRLAFYIINMPIENVKVLANSILDARENVKYCSNCFNLSDIDPCYICDSDGRDKEVIMCVEDPRDMAAYEKTRQFKGTYHVLHGAISPLKGISPDDLKIKELLERVRKEKPKELIIATNPNVEGEVTAIYLHKLFSPLGIKVTRIAHGVPVGGDLEFVDEHTLSKALEGRREMED